MTKCSLCFGRTIMATTEGRVITCPSCGKIKPELLCNCTEDQIAHDHSKEIEHHGILKKWRGITSKGTRAVRNVKEPDQLLDYE